MGHSIPTPHRLDLVWRRNRRGRHGTPSGRRYAALQARKDLIRERGLKRLLTGGRIAGYDEVAEHLSPKEYVAEVVAGKRWDPALTFQLENGLVS